MSNYLNRQLTTGRAEQKYFDDLAAIKKAVADFEAKKKLSVKDIVRGLVRDSGKNFKGSRYR